MVTPDIIHNIKLNNKAWKRFRGCKCQDALAEFDSNKNGLAYHTNITVEISKTILKVLEIVVIQINFGNLLLMKREYM